MRNKFSLVFVIVSLLVGSSSCSIQDVDFVQMNSYAVNKVSKNEAKFTLNVKLDNPNKFNIRITKADLRLSVGGNDAGKIDLVEKVKLKKRTEGDYDIIIIADPEKITKAALQSGLTILLTGKVTVRVKGWVRGKAFGIGAKVQVDESHNIPVDKLKSIE